MNKISFLSFFVILLLFSCVEKNVASLPSSNGDINNISVVVDYDLWNSQLGDSIRSKLARPVLGLMQEEPLFTLNQYPNKLEKGSVRDNRTIIVINIEPTEAFTIKRDQYAAPQTIFHLQGATPDVIIKLLEQNSAKIIQLIKDEELVAIQKMNSKSLLDPVIIANKFYIELNIPYAFEYALAKPNFTWLRKEMDTGSMNLLIYEVPLSSISIRNPLPNIIKMRDSVSRLYIKGNKRQMPMITNKEYVPCLSKTTLNNHPSFVTLGAWKLKNHSISSPFVNYVIFDKEYNRILVLEGFCYSQINKKRDMMFELESIIKSVRFASKNKIFPSIAK